MNKISVYIIAYNEAEKVRDAINSVKWADEIIVADSHSTDGTDKIATDLGAKVVQIDFDGFGKLRNEAISHCTGDWIFSLDSDERCTEEAKKEILSIVQSKNVPHDIYFMPRKNFFMGRWIKHSGWYPNYRQPQLFKNKKMKYTLEPVHEGYESLSDKPLGHLKKPIWQMPFKDLEEVIEKMNRYSTLGASKLEGRRKKISMLSALLHAKWGFIKHYIFKLGFLDGWAGFVIALGSFEVTFYRYAKAVWEKKFTTPQQSIKGTDNA